MNNILHYLSEPYAIYSVTVPWLFVIYWFCTEARRNPPQEELIWHWMVMVLATHTLAWWVIDDDYISLHMIDAFFLYLIFYLYYGLKITPGAAYTLVFLTEWGVDMTKALELIPLGLASPSTYYFGVGGAGYMDGLCIFPIIAAALVHYVAWRRKKGP